MFIEAQRDLPFDEQIKAASAAAGVPAAVLDGIWRTESNRGTHGTMVGPTTKWGTAKGHFQQLDGISKEWSRRAGRDLDPFDFSDGLSMAASQIAENMKIYKGDHRKALAAYHGGMDEANWGPKTQAYVQKVMGAVWENTPNAGETQPPRLPRTAPIIDGQGRRPGMPAESIWDADDTTALTSAEGVSLPDHKRSFDFLPSGGVINAALAESYANDLGIEQAKEARTFWGDTVPDAYRVTLNPTFRVLQDMQQDNDYPRDAAFMADLKNNWAKAVEGFTEPHEQEFLLNSTSTGDYVRRKFHLEEQRRNNRNLGDDGLSGMAALFVAAGLDPTTYLTGFGAMKAMSVAGRGAYQLANAGRPVAAVGSAIVENAGANIAYEAALQMYGEHRTPEDYIVSGLMGMAPAAIATPGLMRRGVNAAAERHIGQQVQATLAKEKAEFEAVIKDLGENASPEDIKAELDRRKAIEVKAEVDALKGTTRARNTEKFADDPTSPEALKAAEAELEAESGTANAPRESVMDWRNETSTGVPGGRTYKQFLDKVADGKPTSLRAAARMLRDLADPKVWDMPTRISGNARENVRSSTGVATLRNDSSDFVVVHEAVHVATMRQIEQFQTGNLEGLGDQTLSGLSKLGKLYNELRAEWETTNGRGIGKDPTDHIEYAFLDMHEFAAQAMSSHKFQRYLSERKSSDGVSMYRKFLESVARVLGIKTEGTKLDEVVAALEEVLSARDTNYRDATGATAVYTPKPDKGFAKWFGDSKVTRDGSPVRLYHGTTGDIEAFRPSRKFGNMYFASEDTSYASAFAGTVDEPGFKFQEEGGNVLPLYAKIEDPMVVDYADYTSNTIEVFESSRNDGLMVMDGEQIKIAVVKDPAQFKSAVGNNGEFDAGNPNVAYAPRKNKVAPKPHTEFDLKHGLDALPDGTPIDRAKKKAIRELYRKAEEWVAANPRNDYATRTLMDNRMFNMATPATRLAASENVVARWVSGTLLEQTMGAHGRIDNAAIMQHMLKGEYESNFVPVFNNLYSMYRNERVGLVKGMWDDVLNNNIRREFNREVFAEVEGRLWNNTPSTNRLVRDAADLFEKRMEHMRLAQIEHQTHGYGGLPETSVGYAPHLLDSSKVAAMSLEKRRALTAALAEQFQHGLEDMDESFALRVAQAYIKHATDKANGMSDIPADPLNHGAAEYIRDAMKAQEFTHEEMRAMEFKFSRGSPSHTKKRLKMDTLKTYKDANGETFQLMDLFRTDMTDLVRGHARRVAGEVSLQNYGVTGSAGLSLIREAMGLGQHKLNTDQVAASIQVFSELLGRPVDLNPESQALNGALAYASLTKLGGMGFTQMAEFNQLALQIGVSNALEAVGSMPRLIREIRALARGEKVENGILGSLEHRGGGGEFGVEGYYISPYDTTGKEHEAYGQSSAGPVVRALKKAQYGMGIMSGHRAIQGVQQRGAAEQIVLKSLRLIKEGADMPKNMADMGFTPELIADVRAHIDTAVEWNGGRVKKFDITKMPLDLQNRYQQAVRRGVYQVIQGTFIGERGHWVHNQWGRLLTQFRNYPLVAMEKQLGRTMVVHGGGARAAAITISMIVAAAGVALPVYAARVALNALTREDRDEYIDRMMEPAAITRNLMNYIAQVGLLPDVADGLFSAAGAMGADVGLLENTQNRFGGRASLGSIVPAVGSVEQIMAAPGQVTDPHKLARLLPYSNTPVFTPFIEALRSR